jgi:Family of unknown function (DUF6776)
MSLKPLQSRRLITVQRPALWIMNILATILLMLVLLGLAFDLGRRNAGYDSSDSTAQIELLQRQIQELQSDSDESHRRAAMLERSSRIEDSTSGQLKKSLDKAQAEAVELKKELSFYKSIVSPEENKQSIVIQTVQMKADGEGGFDYKIMISQRGRNDKYARGAAEVSIEGLLKGKRKTLDLSAVAGEVKEPIKFGFKYFQNLTGKLKLPEGFIADFLRVKLTPKTANLDAVDEQFPWDDLTAGENYVGQQ